MRLYEFDQPQAAGCVLYAEDTGRWGFQQRSDSVSDPGVWSTWGGGRKPGETLEQTVRRELAEEGGYVGPLELEPLHSNSQYATFVGRVPHEFEPRLNGESKDWCWVNAGDWPQPIHDKLAESLVTIIPSADLTESISRTVYHYTGLIPAQKILQSGEFELSSVLGSVEQQYAPKGYPYFFSTTRTRHGGYHNMVGKGGVLFVLDGTWFNQRYPGAPMDYFLNRSPSSMAHRPHEAEDRVFSRDATIPIDGVRALHVYVSPVAEPEQRATARQLMILAKRAGIPVSLYRNAAAWRNFDSRNTAPVSDLTGQAKSGGPVQTHQGYLLPWIELLTAKNQSQLSKKADQIRYSLNRDYDRQQVTQGLSTDLSNARKPNAGVDREQAKKIIAFMQRQGIVSVPQLVDALANKWKSAAKNVGENFADGKKPGRKGLSKRVGIPRKATLTQLANIAKSATGERRRMAQWQLNMRRGRAKKNK